MTNHWIVYEGSPEGCTIYERVDYVPSPKSSRALAEEIDGKTKAQAVKVLETMFDRVKTRDNSQCIFCYKGATTCTS